MATDPFVSFAQNLEDVMLWRALGAAVPSGGFYIDVGASDPALLSVTRAFYDRGWHGLNVEPLPDMAARLEAARPRDVTVAAAAGAAPGRATFFRVRQDAQTGLSTLDPAAASAHAAAGATVDRLDVPVLTLAELCAAHVDGPVHFLKIDAEGAEAAVLAGADFATVRPWIVLVECTLPSGEAGPVPWEAGLLAAGYRFVWFDGLNRFFLAEEHAALARHFTVQPNVFDAYVRHDTLLERLVGDAEALAADRLALIGALEARLDAALAAPPPPPPPEPVPEPPAPPPPLPAVPAWRIAARRLVFGLLRPVARPLALRLRLFMIGELMREMADLRAKQDLTIAMIQLSGGGAAAAADGPGTADGGAAGAVERLLLTLALEDGSDGPPAGLSNLEGVG